MPYTRWFKKVEKNLQPTPEWIMHLQIWFLGLVLFGAMYWYTGLYMKIPNPLNKSVADVSIVLIGLSMVLSSVCYFWDKFDKFIVYRKSLGLVGFGFALIHLYLTSGLVKKFLVPQTWFDMSQLAFIVGMWAAIIFTVMAIISNKYSASKLGGRTWRKILRVGYVAVLLIFVHVLLLKSKYWVRWYQSGFDGLPSMSLLVSIFMVVVLAMRVALWWSLKNKNNKSLEKK